MKPHRISEIFPLLVGDDLKSLAADIKENGQRLPIILFEGKILDGRNRWAACKLAKIKPKTVEFCGSRLEAVQHVWSLNRRRRHLNSSQAAMAEVKRAMLCKEYAAEIEKMKAQQPKGGRPKKGKPTQQIAAVSRSERETRSKRAKAAGTNRQYIDDAEKILAEHPEYVGPVERGEKTITQVKRELKEKAREKRRKANAKAVRKVDGTLDKIGAKFATIIADPPWDWGDEGDVDQMGRARPEYQTQTIESLLKLPVASVADVDCHLYLWITNRSLPKGFQLLDAWGFRYITCLTWCKPSFGMGNYFRGQTEHVLFGVKGSQPLKRKDVGTFFNAPRGPDGHSSKPEKFIQIVESVSPGPYLELFSRRQRKNWTSWGAEA